MGCVFGCIAIGRSGAILHFVGTTEDEFSVQIKFWDGLCFERDVSCLPSTEYWLSVCARLLRSGHTFPLAPSHLAGKGWARFLRLVLLRRRWQDLDLAGSASGHFGFSATCEIVKTVHPTRLVASCCFELLDIQTFCSCCLL